jgi:hypothetical protein
LSGEEEVFEDVPSINQIFFSMHSEKKGFAQTKRQIQ